MAKRPIHEIEKKWQDRWETDGVYHAKNTGEKFYGLIEFPYPSGEGLHVGHPRSYTAIDVVTRKQRMLGKDVLFPIGWDAFGLPTENFAIKHKVKPQEATKKNIANFTRQLKSIGFGFDWSREIDTTDPAYFKWTQWQFLKFYNSWYDDVEQRARPIEELPPHLNKDDYRMAFKTASTINWCPRCRIGLANEEAQGGVCERCGNLVEKREKAQWMIRITKYAERLLQDLDTVDYLEKIKAQQIHWIGKSEGAYVDFIISGTQDSVTVFTTRPDTLFGATYLVMSPEHPLIERWIQDGSIKNTEEVQAYRATATSKSDMERTAEGKEKTGCVLNGIVAVHPAQGEQMPVWISDYVLAGYGTGSIMAVPAHDERDHAFAKTFGLPIRHVVSGGENSEDVYTGDGVAMHSDFLDGLPTWKAKDDMISWLAEKGLGSKAVTYKLRDWVFSRQRYWGEPIPIVHCAKCGYVSVPESQLPLLLPDVEAYEPNDEGESPLANIHDWVHVPCPSCGGDAMRETDTMPNWAGSSWYFLRYCDPHNDQALADPEKLKHWMPVDLYNGGMEHTTLHLLYSRFWHKFLWDIGVVPQECGSEPYAKRRSHGLILAQGGEKMSKSKGNVVNPDDVIQEYGADVFRVYEMFMGPFDQPVPWDTNGIEGVRKFLEKVWGLFTEANVVSEDQGDSALETIYHQSVKKITDGIDQLQFNTCISQLMILTNAFVDAQGVPESMKKGYAQILAPFAPHLTEELWSIMGEKESIHRSGWPKYDESKLQSATFELVVQVNGKVRAKIVVHSDIDEQGAKIAALSNEQVQKYLEGKEPQQIRYISGKILSIVV